MSFQNDGFFVDKPKNTVLSGVQLNAIMRNVYGWMTMGLGLTAVVALLLANSGFIPSTPVFLVAIVAQFGIVIGLSWAINKISATVAGLMFFVYAAITGMTFSIFFLVYDLGSIAAAFLTTAGVFGAMTIVGLTTKVDLSKYSTYFFMGLIGLVIAMVINMFLGSGPLDFIISIFGVLLFTALTAYDTQKIARIASNPDMDISSEDTFKFSVIGALTLYLDFINLFLFLLRLFGGGRD